MKLNLIKNNEKNRTFGTLKVGNFFIYGESDVGGFTHLLIKIKPVGRINAISMHHNGMGVIHLKNDLITFICAKQIKIECGWITNDPKIVQFNDLLDGEGIWDNKHFYMKIDNTIKRNINAVNMSTGELVGIPLNKKGLFFKSATLFV